MKTTLKTLAVLAILALLNASCTPEALNSEKTSAPISTDPPNEDLDKPAEPI